MTKRELQDKVEQMVEAIAEKYGATVKSVDMKVGGKMQKTRHAEGGLFDLDGARNILSKNLSKLKDSLTTFEMPGAVKAAEELAAS